MGTKNKDTLSTFCLRTFLSSFIFYNISINLCGHLLSLVFGKEVIQPQVPLRLPCYDFTPVMNHTVVNAPRRLSYLLLVQPTPMV